MEGRRAWPRPRWQTLRALKGAAFAAPFLLGFLFVFVLPVGYAVHESLFTERSSGLGIGGQERVFVGLDNFTRGLGDGAFWASMLRVLVFACVQIPVMLGLALVMALLLDTLATRTAHRYRLAFLIPYMIPGVVAALMWMYLYSPRLGPLTDVLGTLGLDADFYASEMLWVSLGNLLTWHGVGYNMLIIYGALLAVPRELFDAARVDGASELRIALQIKVPYVRGALVLTGMLSIIGMLQIFNEPLLFRQVAPETVTKNYTPILMIYHQAFDAGDYHYAAALSIILALVVGAVSFVFYKLTNRQPL
ncbi:ABC transporter permease subunit [Streptomyces sp. 3MP-14]|uniref:ABC transporter permease subunit n=1 Tax=Streptomyces mimosae TaxID=2586635 RepID=A0A5N6A1Q2_9ACTN|nr:MULTISPECIES: sugar ABC transporter permease [Streptomyces]KAB8162033.1 ABC transporter permease subunit [Streptomyces mimosae]KAB8173730.1 ABC transporter permease subunit [Streptomyces sp. 3MP-14]